MASGPGSKAKIKPPALDIYTTWERPLGEEEFRVIYGLMHFVAHVCDWAINRWNKNSEYKFNLAGRPKTQWPRFFVPWSRLIQAIIGVCIVYYVSKFLIWLMC